MALNDISISNVEIEGYTVQQLESGNIATAPYPLHLAGANGFPVGCYRELINCFSGDFCVTAVDHRGVWKGYPDPSKNFTTADFAQDAITAIERLHNRPIIGIGHSHGGVVLTKAAQMRPDLFRAVILVDGATVPNRLVHPIMSALPVSWVLALFPFVRGSHERQKYWPSRSAFIDRYKAHRTFKHFTEQAMHDYAEFGLRSSAKSGLELSFNPHWESHIFRSVGYLWSLLQGTRTPTLLLHAEHSNLVTAEQFALRSKNLPNSITTASIKNARHLVPFEDPRSVVNAIKPWLETL